jgi:hypothetical protein
MYYNDNSSGSLDAKYYFTHKSGRKVIAQTSSEFYVLQGHGSKDSKVPEYIKNFEADPWGGRTHYRLGFKGFPKFPSTEQYKAEEAINKFWDACRGYEKLFNSGGDPRNSRLSTGYWGSGILKFLACVGNHAIMIGDKELYDSTRRLMPLGNILALPAPQSGDDYKEPSDSDKWHETV